jgi:hypothetical protein
MKVFVSWSGITSRAVAEALTDWMPKVLQSVDPFLSTKDIDKGANWTVELARELKDADFGIICLAPDNLQSPWLNYEAGAITRSVNSRVCPVLFNVAKGEVEAPLAQLQLTSLELDDIFQLMQSMNKQAGSSLSDPDLKEAVAVWWPKLSDQLAVIPVPALTVTASIAPEPVKPTADQGEMLEEVLHRMRALDNRFRVIEERQKGLDPNARHTGWGELRNASEVDDVQMSLMRLAEVNGLDVWKGSMSARDLDFHVRNDLPAIFPNSFLDEAAAAAKRIELRVRFIGPNRTAVFEKDGRTQEAPF